MGKLEDLRVERVDGVDRPATGHRFVIVKSERTAAQLLAELEKSDELTDEQRELVESFKATLTDEGEPEAEAVEKDEAEAEEPAEEPEAAEEPAENEDVEKDEEPAAEATTELSFDSMLSALSTPEGRELVKSVITELVESELAETEEPESVEKAAGTVKSRQPAEQQRESAPVAKAKGEGMFSNIIFGQGRP